MSKKECKSNFEQIEITEDSIGTIYLFRVKGGEVFEGVIRRVSPNMRAAKIERMDNSEFYWVDLVSITILDKLGENA